MLAFSIFLVDFEERSYNALKCREGSSWVLLICSPFSSTKIANLIIINDEHITDQIYYFVCVDYRLVFDTYKIYHFNMFAIHSALIQDITAQISSLIRVVVQRQSLSIANG